MFQFGVLYDKYEDHHSNVVDIDMYTDESIEEDLQPPIQIDLIPDILIPECKCDVMTEEKLTKISEIAYGILKSEVELNRQLEELAQKKKKKEDQNSQKASTLEGGNSDIQKNSGFNSAPRKSSRYLNSSQPPIILQPPGSDKDFTSNLEVVPALTLLDDEQMTFHQKTEAGQSQKFKAASGDQGQVLSEAISPRSQISGRSKRSKTVKSEESQAPEFGQPS